MSTCKRACNMYESNSHTHTRTQIETHQDHTWHLNPSTQTLNPNSQAKPHSQTLIPKAPYLDA